MNKDSALENIGYVSNNILYKLIFHLFSFFSNPQKRQNKIEINEREIQFVIFKVGALGDYIICLDFINLLRRIFPDASIAVIGSNSLNGISELLNNINYVITSDLVSTKKIPKLYSISFYKELFRIRNEIKKNNLFNFFICLNRLESLFGTLKCYLFEKISNAECSMGLDTVNRGFFLNYKIIDNGYLLKHENDYTKEMIIRLSELFNKNLFSKGDLINNRYLAKQWESEYSEVKHIKIVVHPGGGSNPHLEKWLEKRWPINNYISLLEKLGREFQLEVILTGTVAEANLAIQIHEMLKDEKIMLTNLVGKTTIHEIIEILLKCDMFIGSDSGIAHLASYLNVPALIMFFYSDFVGFAPLGENTVLLHSHIKCAPCLYWFEDRPCHGTNWEYKCREEITVETVYASFKKLIASKYNN